MKKEVLFTTTLLVFTVQSWHFYIKSAQQLKNENLSEEITTHIKKLFDTAKTEVDVIFNKTLTDIENSEDKVKSYQDWLDYLTQTVHENFQKNSQKAINTFDTDARNFPFKHIEQYNIYLTNEVINLVDNLITYKEKLKDKLFNITNTYINKIDLRKKAYEEIIGTFGLITWGEKLKDLSEEKQSTWQSIKDFASYSAKIFIEKAKPEAEKIIYEAENRILHDIKDQINKFIINTNVGNKPTNIQYIN